MSTAENKTIVRRFFEVWNRGGTQLVDELAAPNLVVRYPLLPKPLHGHEALLAARWYELSPAYVAMGPILARVRTVLGYADRLRRATASRATARRVRSLRAEEYDGRPPAGTIRSARSARVAGSTGRAKA